MSERDLSDTIEHHGTMKLRAAECRVIVEFGVHLGGSTGAFLKGLPADGELHSWDIAECGQAREAYQGDPRWRFNREDSRLATIPECDMLYIDSAHVRAQVEAELLHAPKVRRWIMLHDTTTYMAEVVPPVLHFLASHPEWRLAEHYDFCNGLTILERA